MARNPRHEAASSRCAASRFREHEQRRRIKWIITVNRAISFVKI
jgi:hypothetical protein